MNALRYIPVFFLVSLILYFPGNSMAQQGAGTAGETTLVSAALGEERVISISLPPDYASSGLRYPVLYLLDGRVHEQHANSAVEFLARYSQIPPMIVVAVYNVDRTRDFSPVHDAGMPTSGGASKFLEYVADELVPHIAANYRTSGFEVIMGHSFGGVFITYALLEKPELFDAYISVSPFLQFAGRHVVTQAATKLKPVYETPKRFYMTVGDEPDYFVPQEEFHSLLKQKSGQAIAVEYVKMGAEDHSSIPYISLFNGLRYVFSDWRLPDEVINQGLLAIDNHFQRISEKYGLETHAPENLLNQLGYTLLANGDIEQAIGVFTENTRRYPQSANVYDSLGDALQANGQLDLARDSYARACELAKAGNHMNLAIFQANLAKVSGKETD